MPFIGFNTTVQNSGIFWEFNYLLVFDKASRLTLLSIYINSGARNDDSNGNSLSVKKFPSTFLLLHLNNRLLAW